MNAKERFEIIVASIEEMVTANELNDHEISNKAFDKACFPKEDREKNVLFEFLLEKKVLEYISERRLMIGYKILLNEENKGVAYQMAWDLSGSSLQSGFISKFKKVFNGLTPLEARDLADPSLYKMIPTWELISGDNREKRMIDMVFDMPREQFENIQKALNLQDFYSFNKEESEFAYFLSKEGKEMEKAFEYVADYFGGNKSDDRDKRLEQDLSSSDVKYLYFDCGFGFNDIFVLLLMQYLKQFRGQIKDADRRFLKSCLDYVDGKPGNLIMNDDATFQEKYDYYMSSATETYTDYDFQLYLYYLKQYDHKKAFSMIKPGIDSNKALKKIIRKHQGIEDDYEKYLDRYDWGEDEDDSVYYATPNSKIYMRNTEPEIWDDDYMDPIPEDPDREEDDETWLVEAAEGYEPEEETQPYFDVVEFEKLCMEMSDFEGVEELTRDPFSKRLTEHHDLNVQEYWEENKDLFEAISSLSAHRRG